MTGRLAFAILVFPLAACGQATLSSTFNARARVTRLPTALAPTLVLTVSEAIYTGEARPGPLPGQAVTVTSPTGDRLVCTFSTDNWTAGGPGPCRDQAGRQYDMILAP